MTCQDCHTGVLNEDHVRIKGSGKVACNECHTQENRHGTGGEERQPPQCYACHTKHAIFGKDREISSVHPSRLKETCGDCHPVQCGETGYLGRLPSIRIASHNKQDFIQSYDRDNCLGCHQGQAAHGETWPIADHECYKCHLTSKGQEAMWGYIHPTADFRTQPAIFAAGVVYQFCILVLLLGGVRYCIRKLLKRS
jgi:hypothetical protein